MADGIARGGRIRHAGARRHLVRHRRRVRRSDARAARARAAGARGRRARCGRVGRPGRRKAASLLAVHESTRIALGTYHAAEAPLPELARGGGTGNRGARAPSVDLRTCGRPKRGRAFVQYLAPPPHVLVCGAGPDAVPVVRRGAGPGLARLGGRSSARLCGRASLCREPRCVRRRARACVRRCALERMPCGGRHEPSPRVGCRVLARTGRGRIVPGYVGLLGPAARRASDRSGTRRRHGSAAAAGCAGRSAPTFGAVTPEGIALAIVSQMHAWLAGASRARTHESGAWRRIRP